MVSNLAQDSLTLEKTNALAPTVESDNRRNIGRTNSAGVATFYMKIIKGRNDLEVAFICESEGTKSPISSIVTLRNAVREVKFVNDFSETITLDYRTNEDGEIIGTDATLSNNAEIIAVDEYERPITNVKADEIFISVLTEEQANLLANYGKTSIAQINEAAQDELDAN